MMGQIFSCSSMIQGDIVKKTNITTTAKNLKSQAATAIVVLTTEHASERIQSTYKIKTLRHIPTTKILVKTRSVSKHCMLRTQHIVEDNSHNHTTK